MRIFRSPSNINELLILNGIPDLICALISLEKCRSCSTLILFTLNTHQSVVRGQGQFKVCLSITCRQRRLSGTVDKFLFDLVLTERVHALALQCLPNFDHLHMFWGSYVKESRD